MNITEQGVAPCIKGSEHAIRNNKLMSLTWFSMMDKY